MWRVRVCRTSIPIAVYDSEFVTTSQMESDALSVSLSIRLSSVPRAPGVSIRSLYSLSVSGYARCAMIPMRICTAIDHADDLIGMDTSTRTVTETETNVIDSRRRRLQCAN